MSIHTEDTRSGAFVFHSTCFFGHSFPNKILETTFGPNKILTCKNKTFHFQVLSPRVFLFAVGYIYGHHKCPLHALKTMYTDEVNYLNFGYTNH